MIAVLTTELLITSLGIVSQFVLLGPGNIIPDALKHALPVSMDTQSIESVIRSSTNLILFCLLTKILKRGLKFALFLH